ncbi:unnamed protein product [Durusdinium trenchii]|uniref:C3H1-type domain-containing protein n=1 Tax=Durusdinium trenchii TaxID=1381693 RepID=A0ABP0J1I9_9DINO
MSSSLRQGTTAPLPDSEDEVNFEQLPGYQKDPCQYCLFFCSPFGCRQGASCNYCHHEPEQPEGWNQRPRKARRERCKRRLQLLLGRLTVDQPPGPEIHSALQLEAQRNAYSHAIAKSLLTEHLQRHGARVVPVGATSCRASLRFSL